jgi:pilus assembly protein Flp/PilA
MRHIIAHLRALVAEDDGATMVEYGLMLALIAVVCILVITLLGSSARNVFDNVTLKNALG